MLGILAVFLAVLLGIYSVNKTASSRLKNLQLEAVSLSRTLEKDYLTKYKDILRSNKKIDFPYYLNAFLEVLPYEWTRVNHNKESIKRPLQI